MVMEFEISIPYGSHMKIPIENWMDTARDAHFDEHNNAENSLHSFFFTAWNQKPIADPELASKTSY